MAFTHDLKDNDFFRNNYYAICYERCFIIKFLINHGLIYLFGIYYSSNANLFFPSKSFNSISTNYIFFSN